MQYTDELLHIYVLTKAPDFQNPHQSDAGLRIEAPRTLVQDDTFECAGLGKVELRQSIHSFWAMIALKVD